MKARIAHVHPEANGGKLAHLDALHRAYRAEVQDCVDRLVQARRWTLSRPEYQSFFSKSERLSSQLQKAAREQAVQMVRTWAQGVYKRVLRDKILESSLSEPDKIQLWVVGKYQLQKPRKFRKGEVPQTAIETYRSWLFDPEVCGASPRVSDTLPMQLGEMTARVGPANTATAHGGFWLEVSSLERRQRIVLPLAATPYLTSHTPFAKSVVVFPRDDRWVVQLVDKRPVAPADGSLGKMGVDVGLNVVAATSDGRLYGADVKPRFDRLRAKIRSIRANRQRQNLRESSPRLQRLEQRLTGFMVAVLGRVANLLVKEYPDHTFVVEDLDLRGCRGQKRFAYRLLQQRLASKAICQVVSAAYTSQPCPSCGYVSRANRSGTRFRCRSCGRISHADVIGAINLLGRSEDQQIRGATDYRRVGAILRERYRARRRNSSEGRGCRAPPLRRTLTTPHRSTASNGAME
jgi:hypothetical protein